MGRLEIKLPYLTPKKAKGRGYYYYRRGGQWIPLPEPTDTNFRASYDKVHASFESTAEVSRPGTIKRLIEDYKSSGEYTDKSAKTRKDYDRYLAMIDDMWGDLRVSQVTRKAVFTWRDQMAKTPRSANYAMQVTRLLFNFAIDRELIVVNPARRPKKLATGPGHKAWPDQAITQFLTAKDQDPMMILALVIGLYTGLREGDCLKLNRAHFNGEEFSTVASKNKEPVWVTALTPLKTALAPVVKQRYMLLVTKTGRAFSEHTFRHYWRAAVLKAGLDGLTFHGLRTTAATILAEWCNDAQLQAIFGWRDPKTPAHYRRLAERRKLARIGMAEWERKLTGV